MVPLRPCSSCCTCNCNCTNATGGPGGVVCGSVYVGGSGREWASGVVCLSGVRRVLGEIGRTLRTTDKSKERKK